MGIAEDLEWLAVVSVPFAASILALLATVLLRAKLMAFHKGLGGAEFGDHMNELSAEIQKGAM